MVSSETVKLNCRTMEPDKDWGGELYFDTDTGSAKYSSWPWEPVIFWSYDVIIWSSYSKNYSDSNGHLTGLFYYDRNEDLLQIKVISDTDVSELAQKYGSKSNDYPFRCRKRSF